MYIYIQVFALSRGFVFVTPNPYLCTFYISNSKVEAHLIKKIILNVLCFIIDYHVNIKQYNKYDIISIQLVNTVSF